jgi:hypothetical protein
MHLHLLSPARWVLQDAVRSAIKEGPSAMVQLPDGSHAPVRNFVQPPRRGRKVVLLGDTCNSRAILSENPPPCSPLLPSRSALLFSHGLVGGTCNSRAIVSEELPL